MNRRIEIPIQSVASCSGDGRVYRVFGYLLAVRASGELFVVPMPLVTGDLRRVVDSCPVPWLEVIALIDAESEATEDLDESVLHQSFPWLSHIEAQGWCRDYIGLTPGGRRNIERLIHSSGIRYARVSS